MTSAHGVSHSAPNTERLEGGQQAGGGGGGGGGSPGRLSRATSRATPYTLLRLDLRQLTAPLCVVTDPPRSGEVLSE